MMCIPLTDGKNVFLDNESVVKSSMNPSASLKQKYVSITYHEAHEMFAADVIKIYFVPSSENLVDLFTKVLPIVQQKKLYRSGIFY